LRIGIIGAGFIGRAVAGLAVRSGHDVLISNSRGPETLGSTVVALGCRAGGAVEAAAFGDVVVLAIPFRNDTSIPAAPLDGKPVLDANNYDPQGDGQQAALDRHETTASEMIAVHLQGAKLVKAFNAILQRDLAEGGAPPGAAGRRALPIAGDNGGATAVATTLHDEFGYDVVDAGPLSEGWRFERAMPAYCIKLDEAGLRPALARAEPGVEAPHGSWRG